MRRRKKGKISPLNLTACSPGALLASLRPSSPEVPEGTRVGEGRGPQGSLLAGYLLAGSTHIALLLFLDVLVQTRALRKERERFLQPGLQGFPLTLASLNNDDGDGNENGQKAIGSNKQNNNFARASRFFVHFFAVVARLRRETS